MLMKWKRLTKPRFLFVYPLVVWLFLVAKTTERQLHVGLLLMVCGEALRLWANGYVGRVKVNLTQRWRGDAKIGQLVTAGPYAYVRHPLYLGTFLIGAGFCVMVGNIWFSLAAVSLFLITYGNKMAEEDEMLEHEWGETFVAYRHAVSQWLPWRRPYRQPNGQWSWQGILASRELKTVVWVSVAVILLYFREELIQQRESFLAEDHVLKHGLLIALLASLILADAIVEIRRRWKRRQAVVTAEH